MSWVKCDDKSTFLKLEKPLLVSVLWRWVQTATTARGLYGKGPCRTAMSITGSYLHNNVTLECSALITACNGLAFEDWIFTDILNISLSLKCIFNIQMIKRYFYQCHTHCHHQQSLTFFYHCFMMPVQKVSSYIIGKIETFTEEDTRYRKQDFQPTWTHRYIHFVSLNDQKKDNNKF